MQVPESAAGEEAGNARRSTAALYPLGDDGRRAERRGCAAGHVPHPHIAPLPHCLDRKQPFLPSPLVAPCPITSARHCTNVPRSFSAGPLGATKSKVTKSNAGRKTESVM